MASPAPEIRRISAEALAALMDETKAVTILDVRDPADYFSSSLTILGAISIPPDRFEHFIRDIPREAPIVLFGAGMMDNSPVLGAAILHRYGCTDVAILEEGWNGWIARDYPTMEREL